MLCKSCLIVIVKELPEDGIVIGETNSDFLDSQCVLVNENNISVDENILRIEYYEKVNGVKVGYFEVGYGEYVVLKSIEKMRYRLFLLIIGILVMCDFMMLMRYYS